MELYFEISVVVLMKKVCSEKYLNKKNKRKYALLDHAENYW